MQLTIGLSTLDSRATKHSYIKNKPLSITYAWFKINSKWIIGLNAKWKSIKPREENIDEKSLYACLEEFLDIIPKHN